MTSFINTQNNSFQFIVNKKQVSKNKALKASILYDKVEFSANKSIDSYPNLVSSIPKTFELNFIQNAYLNDKLIVKNNIQKLNDTELTLSVTVVKKEKQQDIICKAVFGYTLKRAS